MYLCSCSARPRFLCFLGAEGLTNLFLFPSRLLPGVNEGRLFLPSCWRAARGDTSREKLKVPALFSVSRQEEEVVVSRSVSKDRENTSSSSSCAWSSVSSQLLHLLEPVRIGRDRAAGRPEPGLCNIKFYQQTQPGRTEGPTEQFSTAKFGCSELFTSRIDLLSLSVFFSSSF